MVVAAQNGHVDIIKTLVDLGANVNTPANDGTTPVYVATQNGHVDVIKTLVDLCHLLWGTKSRSKMLFFPYLNVFSVFGRNYFLFQFRVGTKMTRWCSSLDLEQNQILFRYVKIR
jgi:ankyrin repeat protein